MFERFSQRYKVTSRLLVASSGSNVQTPLEKTPGYEEFMEEYAGATFNNGVYRVHTLDSRVKWDRLIQEVFPRFEGQFSAFAYDWMGRQFALDSKRRENDQPMVVLFDPGFGEVLEVPGTLQQFHDDELVAHSDAALGDNVFEEWLQAGNRPPGPTECVGYKVPLFLGGVDELKNFGLSDMEVYWSFSGQILEQTRNLPAGTPIGRVKTE